MKNKTVIEIQVEDIDDVMAEDRDFIVPLVLNHDTSEGEGVLCMEVYSDALKIAKKYASKYESKWFEEKSLLDLWKLFEKYFKKHGYLPQTDGQLCFYNNYYRSTPLNNDEKSHVLECTVKMNDSLSDIENISGLTADDGVSLPDESFVTVCDGKIVSVATVNDYSEDSNVIEVTVETAKEYQGKGFGKSNILALTDHLISRGYRVAYCTENTNASSNSVALKCGFIHCGRIYAVCGYKN